MSEAGIVRAQDVGLLSVWEAGIKDSTCQHPICSRKDLILSFYFQQPGQYPAGGWGMNQWLPTWVIGADVVGNSEARCERGNPVSTTFLLSFNPWVRGIIDFLGAPEM